MTLRSVHTAFALALSALFFATTTFAAVSLSVTPVQGPNPLGSATTANNFYSNVISNLGGTSVPNNDDTPTGLGTLTPDYSEILSTFFPSWNGSAAPTPGWDDGTSTAGAFSSQFGNAVFFSLAVSTDAADKVTLADLTGSLIWIDPGTGLQSTILTNSLTLSGLPSYTSTRVGVLAGADTMVGTPDDTFITSGASNQLVDGLYLVGLADTIQFGSAIDPGATDQENIDLLLNGLTAATAGQHDLTVEYAITSQMGMLGDSETTLNFVPEPKSLAIFAALFGFIAFRQRRA